MNARPLLLPLAALALASCDKAKNIADQAATAVQQQIAEKAGGAENTAPDPELQKLVDQTDGGVLFRKDLPFPTRLEVRVTRREELAGRFFHASAIEKRGENLKGTRVHIAKLERAGDQVRHTLEQSSFSVPSADGSGEAKTVANPLEQVAPTLKPLTFRRFGTAWRVENPGDFRTAAISKQVGPALDGLLVENALAPRRLWFGKKRLAIGETLSVTGETLPMLLEGGKGSFQLKLEGLEAVAGHPCGVFSVTGDYTRRQFPDFEGGFTDEDVTIQSGRLWLSLLYPVVLREELDTIRTLKSGGQGGQVGRGRGTAKVSVKREWKAL